VIHRDLKPENFLFANKKENSPLKAIDFGLSIFFKPGKLPPPRSVPDLGELLAAILDFFSWIPAGSVGLVVGSGRCCS